MARNHIEGLDALMRDFQKLGRVPQTVATQSARAAGLIALRAARAKAPVDIGNLKLGLIMKREKSRTKGKSVYQVTLDHKFNKFFVKVSKDGKRSYYPASQEYGFLSVNGRYIPGYRYLRRAIDDNKSTLERKMIETAGKAIDKILRKKGLR